MMVAPFAGAWIEILLHRPGKQLMMSLPSRERGLKFKFVWLVCSWRIYVAPFAGAWIEIVALEAMNSKNYPVAPFAGAWIEI